MAGLLLCITKVFLIPDDSLIRILLFINQLLFLIAYSLIDGHILLKYCGKKPDPKSGEFPSKKTSSLVSMKKNESPAQKRLSLYKKVEEDPTLIFKKVR